MKTEFATEDRVHDELEDDDQVNDMTADEEEKINSSSYDWGDLGPSFEIEGETRFLAVRRKECKVFDLVNLDWYRSSEASSSDPSSSSIDLWHYFKCGYSNQTWFKSDGGQDTTISEIGVDVFEKE